MSTTVLSEEVVITIDSVLRNQTEKLAKEYADSALGRRAISPASFVIGLTVISDIAATVREMAPDSAYLLYEHQAPVVLARMKQEFENVWSTATVIHPDLAALNAVYRSHRTSQDEDLPALEDSVKKPRSQVIPAAVSLVILALAISLSAFFLLPAETEALAIRCGFLAAHAHPKVDSRTPVRR